MSVLVIGPPGAGKTSLLTLLQAVQKETDKRDLPSTIQTVGTNLFNIAISKKREVVLRELGGVMGPLWKNYLSDICALIYVVDISNAQQVAASFIQLVDILNGSLPARLRILLLFNKSDLVSPEARAEWKGLFLLQDLLRGCPLKTHVRNCSAKNSADLLFIRDWLRQSLR